MHFRFSSNLFSDFGYQFDNFITSKRLIRLRRIWYACEATDLYFLPIINLDFYSNQFGPEKGQLSVAVWNPTVIQFTNFKFNSITI